MAVIEEVPLVLHHIQLLAKTYLVPERLVARRLFHDLRGGDLSLIGVRLQGGRGKVAWFAPAPSRSEVKKKVENRIVPLELLPHVPIGKTSEVEVDGRWWLLVGSAMSADRAKPLKLYRTVQADRAWVGRTEDAWYIALPSKADQITTHFS